MCQPSRCHHPVQCLLQTLQLCPGAAIMGRTPKRAVPRLLGMAQRQPLPGRVWEHAPHPTYVEYGNRGVLGCGLQTTAQSPFTCCNAGLSLSRDTKPSVEREQVMVLRQCPAQAGWVPSPAPWSWHRACQGRVHGCCLGFLCSQPRKECGCEPVGSWGGPLWGVGGPGVGRSVNKLWVHSTVCEQKSMPQNLETCRCLWSWPAGCNIQKCIGHLRGEIFCVVLEWEIHPLS